MSTIVPHKKGMKVKINIMKKKAIRFIKDNKSSISLFVIVFVASLMAALSSLFGADRLARVVLSVSAGALTLMGVDYLGDKVDTSGSDHSVSELSDAAESE